MGLFSSYVYKSEDKTKWWLHVKEKNKIKFYYFSKDAIGALPALPRGYEVFINERSNIPMLRKKKGKKETGNAKNNKNS